MVREHGFTPIRPNRNNAAYASSDSDTSSISWITLTTYLSYGGNDRWALASDVTHLDVNGPATPVSTHIIGLGVNSQFSVVAGSDYCRRTYTRYLSAPPVYTDLEASYNAQYKGGNGYAVYYNIYDTEITNEIYFAVAIKPNNSTAIVVDGYGHYAKRDTQITPHISISSSGVDMTITPEQNVSYMPSTHVQVDR